jgi:murein DD-endopeptidase MepM/ murein hydrolase activator NlpD
MIRAFLLVFLVASAAAQQPVSHTPTSLQSGSPVLFRAVLPEATALRGTWLNHQVVFTRTTDGASWFLLAGIDVEQAPGTYTLTLSETLADGSTKSLTEFISIGPASYRTSKIQVPDKFLQPDAETQARIERESALKKEAFARNTPSPLWSGSFAPPVPLSPTDSFGTRRTFNGTLASIHKGTDFRAAAGTPVYAANDGIVLIAQPMFYEGNFVLLDHGQQFMTMYMHFSRIDVHVGDHVRKGQQLGLSGATGRVTGPHLHLGVRWQGAYLDPVKLLALPLPAR